MSPSPPERQELDMQAIMTAAARHTGIVIRNTYGTMAALNEAYAEPESWHHALVLAMAIADDELTIPAPKGSKEKIGGLITGTYAREGEVFCRGQLLVFGPKGSATVELIDAARELLPVRQILARVDEAAASVGLA